MGKVVISEPWVCGLDAIRNQEFYLLSDSLLGCVSKPLLGLPIEVSNRSRLVDDDQRIGSSLNQPRKLFV